MCHHLTKHVANERVDTVVVVTNYCLYETFKSSFIRNHVWDGSKCSRTPPLFYPKEPCAPKGHAGKVTNHTARNAQSTACTYKPVPSISGYMQTFVGIA